MKDKTGNDDCIRKGWHGQGAGGGAVYGLDFIGALTYYLQHATSVGMGVLGVLKAMVWPVLLVYKALEFLKM